MLANLLKHYRTVACDLLERMGKAGAPIRHRPQRPQPASDRANGG